MTIYEEIKQLKAEIEELNSQLAAIRGQIEKTQDGIIKNALKVKESGIIDDIDAATAKLESKEAEIPEKRTNGHHKAESEEEEELKPDFKPDDKDDRKN